VQLINREGHHVANRLDVLNKFQRRDGEKEYLAIYPQKTIRCVELGMTKYGPLRMNALEIAGDSTISSTGFPVGSICRDRRVYDSGYASLGLCEKKREQKYPERT
jgi:hypothetical protein